MEEVYPYKAMLDSGLVRMIMTAHIVNHVLDSALLPATLSKKIVTDFLRGFLNYDGVVISDDMQMGAISKEYGLEEAIKLSINAGVDMIMFANNVPDSDLVTADIVHKIIRSKVENNEIPIRRIEESYKRISKLKYEMGLKDHL
jgi:beta-N-acetylhexosaminidase